MEFLTREELAELTERIQSDAQARELDALGIPYRRRRDRSPVVMRAVVETVLGISNVRTNQNEPRLNLI
jgi:hypothetical protein